MSVSQETLKKYQSKYATREVLGCLIKEPILLKSHKITIDDFVESFHKVVFVGINNCYSNNINKLDETIVAEYLREAFPSKYIIFSRNEGEKYIERATELCHIENFEANYTELKKFSLLRKLLKEGFDVSDFFDPKETDSDENDKKRELLELSSIEDILTYFKKKIVAVTDEYSLKNGRDSVKAGSNEAREQKEKWKKTPEFGLSYASQYFNTITRGIRKKRFVVGSAQSGTGKTRLSVANLCFSFIPRFYDSTKKEWVQNPHGIQNAGLYIGTEMELIEEIEPILWAYIADVPEDHIISGQYLPGEESRVDEAINILHNEARIYLEYVPDYDVGTLERIIDEHVVNHNVRHVFFDYIHTTTDLISEFQGEAKAKMQVREDQVLNNLSTKLKELTRKYNISFDTWTQVNSEIKNEQSRDESVVRGARAIIDKCDTAFIATRPTVKELKILEKIIKSSSQIGKPTPNLCFSIYKNRGGKYNKVKIWLYVNYDTMRVHDLFVTDYDYQLVVIPKTYVGVTEDMKIFVADTAKDVQNKLIELRKQANEIEDDGSIIDLDEEFEDIDEDINRTEETKEIKESKRDKYLRESTQETLQSTKTMHKVDENIDF